MRILSKKALARIILVVVIVALFAVALYIVDHYSSRKNDAVIQSQSALSDPYAEDDGVARVYYEGNWYVPKSVETILIIGVDDEGEQQDYEGNVNHSMADFLMLLIVDHEENKYQALQLNRDTMTEITTEGVTGEYAGTAVAQLALAHSYGSGLEDSCEYTVRAVSDLLYGVQIEHYAALSMDSIGILNDAVGGVEVTVPVDMSAYDPKLTEGAQIRLNAEQAELFVRTRKDVDDSTNLSRMKRQQVFMSSFKNAALETAETDAEFALRTVLDISDYLVSDMSVYELSDFANILIDYEDLGVTETMGKNVAGEIYMEFYVDEDALYEQVIDLFYERAKN